MFGQRLAQLELVRLGLHPGRHRFHQMFVGLRVIVRLSLFPRAPAF